MQSENDVKSGRNRQYGCWLVVGGNVCFFVSIVILVILGSSDTGLPYSYYPLVWSPQGDHLAFGVVKGYKPNWKLFVVDADGSNFRKLVDKELWYDNEGEELYDFRWSAQGDKIYFTSIDDLRDIEDVIRYYVVDLDSKKSKQISAAEFAAIPTPGDTSLPDTSGVRPTECDKVPASHLSTRSAHANGLIAQSACLDPDRSLYSCIQELQVCDTNTGKLLFDSSDFPDSLLSKLLDIIVYTAVIMLVVSGLLIIAGPVVIIRGWVRRLCMREQAS